MVRENDAECRRIAESAAEMATFLTEHVYTPRFKTLSGESVSADPDPYPVPTQPRRVCD
jgi:hypothetical protein